MFTLGINTNNEYGKTTNEILENIKTAGFTHVMVAAKSGAFEQSIKYALSLGLQIPFVHLSTNYPSDIWSIGPTREEYIKTMCNEIEICAKYNIPIAVMHAVTGDQINKVVTPYKNGLSAIKQIVNFAKQHNVKIAIENLDSTNNKRVTYLINHIKDENLGFCYDSGHHNLYNAKFNFLKKFKNRVLAIHLHDNLMDYSKGYDYSRDLHRLPFDGNVNFEKVCKNLAKINYNNTIMLEVHKISVGAPQLYSNIKPLTFLQEARNRAEKLALLIENFKK